LTANSDDNTSESSNSIGNNNTYEREPKAYTFSGRVVLGIGLVLAAAAGATIAAMSVSTSPSVHLPQVGAAKLTDGPLTTTSFAQKQSSPTQHIDKRFVLIQNDFGWNGTTGGPPIVVNKGEVVQITVINAGRMAHNFGIGQPSQQTIDIMKQTQNMPLPDRVRYIPYNTMAAMPCPGCHPLFEQAHIKQFMQPDTQQVTTFSANQAGNFKYFCMVRGHIWLGMVGDLIVQDNASNSPQSAVTQVNSNVTAGTVRGV
jgi:uncharacterized cupredoxin-like copper-binding protein